jgi:hypothetical protein
MYWSFNSVQKMILDTSGNLTISGIISAKGYINSVPSITNNNPWLGTPTTSRLINTVYHNLSGKTIVVYIDANPSGAVASFTNYGVVDIGSSSTPSTQVGIVSNTAIATQGQITAIIPNGWYYEFITTGICGIGNWAEAPL